MKVKTNTEVSDECYFLFVSHLPVCNTCLSYILTKQRIRKGSRQIDADLQREALNVTKHRFGNVMIE